MWKKSHILLAKHLTEYYNVTVDINHTMAFSFGSIVPDIVPSFISKRHRIDETFDIVQRKMQRVLKAVKEQGGPTLRQTRNLGIILHYVADYFTYPHNKEFPGTVKDHIYYEHKLHQVLLNYRPKLFEGPNADLRDRLLSEVQDTDEICEYILASHKQYLESDKCQETDCYYIENICFTVLTAMLILFTEAQEEATVKVLPVV